MNPEIIEQPQNEVEALNNNRGLIISTCRFNVHNILKESHENMKNEQYKAEIAQIHQKFIDATKNITTIGTFNLEEAQKDASAKTEPEQIIEKPPEPTKEDTNQRTNKIRRAKAKISDEKALLDLLLKLSKKVDELQKKKIGLEDIKKQLYKIIIPQRDKVTDQNVSEHYKTLLELIGGSKAVEELKRRIMDMWQNLNSKNTKTNIAALATRTLSGILESVNNEIEADKRWLLSTAVRTQRNPELSLVPQILGKLIHNNISADEAFRIISGLSKNTELSIYKNQLSEIGQMIIMYNFNTELKQLVTNIVQRGVVSSDLEILKKLHGDATQIHIDKWKKRINDEYEAVQEYIKEVLHYLE